MASALGWSSIDDLSNRWAARCLTESKTAIGIAAWLYRLSPPDMVESIVR